MALFKFRIRVEALGAGHVLSNKVDMAGSGIIIRDCRGMRLTGSEQGIESIYGSKNGKQS